MNDKEIRKVFEIIHKEDSKRTSMRAELDFQYFKSGYQANRNKLDIAIKVLNILSVNSYSVEIDRMIKEALQKIRR